ncbi:MAG: hypothetical protein Q9P01_21110 [Anaerolineae bacterium]|nr:hypothetical protein [Anaerolineae bacterium]
MDIRLIRANIALAEDDRLEVLRLLEAYRHSPDTSNVHDSLVMWLEAHAQTDHNALIRHLEKLLKKTAPYDPYHQMAHDYLWKEDTYADTIADVQHQARAVPGLTWRRVMGGTIGVVLTIVTITFLLRWTGRNEELATIPTRVAIQATALPTALPDNTQRLNLNDHMARYEGGLLMVAALEDESLRVIDNLTRERLEPVEGARFYVLQLHFECRQGICSEPPEAILSLILDNEFSVPPRDGAIVQSEETMTPIALGRRTVGWVVFEVPVVSEPIGLSVTPNDLLGRENPVTIALPSLNSP